MANLPQVVTERALTFKQAAARCPGRAVSVKTIYAWADLGVKVGEARVKLEAARVGGRRVTSVEALERFVAAMSGEKVEPPVPQSRTKRQQRVDAARKQFLKQMAEI